MNDESEEALFERVLAEEEASSARAEKPIDPRRAHQCHWHNCDSQAEWDVHLHVRYGWHHVAVESLKFNRRVCEKHRKAASQFILSDHNKKIISAKLATYGRLGIDWENAMVEFVPCGEEAWTPTRMQELKVA